MSITKKLILVDGVVGAAALADCFLFGEGLTGFMAGSVFWRYLALGMAAAGLWLLCRGLEGRRTVQLLLPPSAGRAGMLSAGLLAVGALCAVLTWQLPWMICGGLFGAGALWLAGVFKQETPPAKALCGYILTGAFLFSAMLQYLLRPASREHLLLTVSLLAAGAGMLFITALLRYVYLPDARRPRQLAFYAALCGMAGMLAAVQMIFGAAKGELTMPALARLLPVAALMPAAFAALCAAQRGLEQPEEMPKAPQQEPQKDQNGAL